MLRKKLSKLIVGIMTAVMVTVGGSGVGQAAFANSNVGVVATQTGKVVNVDTTTNANETDVIKLINDTTVSTLNVTRDLDLTPAIVDAINKRTTPLTIEVGNHGILIIKDAITLDGRSSSLKLVRVGTKSGAIIETKDKNQGVVTQVTIKGVTFENKSTSNNNDPYFINGKKNPQSTTEQDPNFSVTLEGNTIVSGVNGNGILAYDRRPAQGQTTPVTNFIGNNLGSGSITNSSTHTLTAEIINPVSAGSTVATVNGTILGNLVAGATGTAKITITDASDEVVKTSNDLTITNGSVQWLAEGLTPGTNYKAFVEVAVKDANLNSYTRKSASVSFTTINFSSSVTNIGNNSATININHGNLPASSYNNLIITVSGGTATPSSISATTNSINVTGLTAGTSYTYEIKSGTTVIDKGTFRTTSSTITGGGSTGGSVTSGDLTTNDINRADIKDVSVSIPVGNTTLANSLRDGKDYKTNIEGVTVTYSNGKVEFTGLVPEKDYRDLTITYTDKDGRTRTVKVPSFKTKVSETKLRQFIVDVYRYSLDRVADERGFAYWEDQLKNKKTSPADFVKNLLNEREFINKHTTTTAKIEGLYQVIVNRKSDSQGLSFWTKKYDDLVARGYSESMALRVIVDEMVNEQEFKNRVRDLGL